jgi:hypothetical protein
LSLLCALALCAFAAPNAFAKGTTAFNCVKTEKEAAFSDAHCTKAGTGAGYKHQAIVAGEKTTIVLSNKNTESETTKPAPASLHIKLVPMDAEIKCQTVFGEGTLTNNVGPPMNVSGTVTVTFSECALVAPAGTFPGCELESSTIVTKALLSTPAEAMTVRFSEDEGVFAKFHLVNCTSEAFNTEYQMSGSYEAIPNGATWETTAESSKGLKTAGGQAGLVSKTTVTMSPTNPGIAMTTTES